MVNARAQLLWSAVALGLGLAYGIYMLMYLNSAQKCDRMLKPEEVNFRKAAVVITWISVILTGLGCLAAVIGFLAGGSRPAILGGIPGLAESYSPLASGMGFY